MLNKELLSLKLSQYLEGCQLSDNSEIIVDDIKDNDKDFDVTVVVDPEKIDELDEYDLQGYIDSVGDLKSCNIEVAILNKDMFEEISDSSDLREGDGCDDGDYPDDEIELDSEHGLARGDYNRVIHTADDDEEEDDEIDDRDEKQKLRDSDEYDGEDSDSYEEDSNFSEDDGYIPDQADFSDLESFNREWGIEDDDRSRY